jgi:hypothetical protein
MVKLGGKTQYIVAVPPDDKLVWIKGQLSQFMTNLGPKAKQAYTPKTINTGANFYEEHDA